jgi:hypothetical protein
VESENCSGITNLIGIITIIFSAGILLGCFLMFGLLFVFGYFGNGQLDFWTYTLARISYGVFYLSNIPLLFAGIKILKTKNISSVLAFTASLSILLNGIVFLRSYFSLFGYKNLSVDSWIIFPVFILGVYSVIYILLCCFTCPKMLLNELIPPPKSK